MSRSREIKLSNGKVIQVQINKQGEEEINLTLGVTITDPAAIEEFNKRTTHHLIGNSDHKNYVVKVFHITLKEFFAKINQISLVDIIRSVFSNHPVEMKIGKTQRFGYGTPIVKIETSEQFNKHESKNIDQVLVKNGIRLKDYIENDKRTLLGPHVNLFADYRVLSFYTPNDQEATVSFTGNLQLFHKNNKNEYIELDSSDLQELMSNEMDLTIRTKAESQRLSFEFKKALLDVPYEAKTKTTKNQLEGEDYIQLNNYLEYLALDLGDTPFTRKDFLLNEVPGDTDTSAKLRKIINNYKKTHPKTKRMIENTFGEVSFLINHLNSMMDWTRTQVSLDFYTRQKNAINEVPFAIERTEKQVKEKIHFIEVWNKKINIFDSFHNLLRDYVDDNALVRLYHGHWRHQVDIAEDVSSEAKWGLRLNNKDQLCAGLDEAKKIDGLNPQGTFAHLIEFTEDQIGKGDVVSEQTLSNGQKQSQLRI